MTGPSSVPRGERPGTPGTHWETRLTRTEQVIPDDAPDPAPPNRKTRRAMQRSTEEQVTNRYDDASPVARALLDDFDEIDLAEMLATAQAATDSEIRRQLDAAIEALAKSEAELRRVRDTNQRLVTERVDAEEGITAAIRRAKHEEKRALRAEATIDRVRAATHITDTDDATDWQRGYRACTERTLAALDEPLNTATADCVHPEGYDGECPCAPNCACCKTSPEAPSKPAPADPLAALRARLAAEHVKANDAAARSSIDECVTAHSGIATGLGIALRWLDHHMRQANGGAERAAPAQQPDAEWTPPPPGSTREQLPPAVLALLPDKPYLSTACDTAQQLQQAPKPTPANSDAIPNIAAYTTRLHARCRRNHKFTGQLCICPCHPHTPATA